MTLNYTLSERTKTIYSEHLTRLCCFLDDPPFEQIDNYDLAMFMTRLRRRDGKLYSPGYLNQVYRTLHTFFGFYGEGDNIMDHIKRPRLETGPKPRLSLAQVVELLTSIRRTENPSRNLAIVLLMLDCGLRKSEVVGLRAGDLFLEEDYIYVRSSKTHACRNVPLSEMCSLALEDYLSLRRSFGSINEPVFLLVKGSNKGQPLTVKAIEQLMKRLKRRLGFPLYAHLLRHTFGNHYIRAGGLRYLQKILGHSRIDTTARFYTDPDFADIQAEHRRAAPTAQIWGE